MTYPPSKEECVNLFSELKKLDSAIASEFTPRKYEIIHDLAEAHFYEAKPYFVSGLESGDPDYRWACISALVTHWSADDSNIVDKLMEMAEQDSDVDVRIIAISSLGFLKIRNAKPLLEKISASGTEEKHIVETAQKTMRNL